VKDVILIISILLFKNVVISNDLKDALLQAIKYISSILVKKRAFEGNNQTFN